MPVQTTVYLTDKSKFHRTNQFEELSGDMTAVNAIISTAGLFNNKFESTAFEYVLVDLLTEMPWQGPNEVQQGVRRPICFGGSSNSDKFQSLRSTVAIYSFGPLPEVSQT